MTRPNAGVIEGAYLCPQLDLKSLFGAGVETIPALRLYSPEEMPAPERNRFALVWRPSPDGFAASPNLDLI